MLVYIGLAHLTAATFSQPDLGRARDWLEFQKNQNIIMPGLCSHTLSDGSGVEKTKGGYRGSRASGGSGSSLCCSPR